MRAVDHDVLGQLGLGQRLLGERDRHRIVVGAPAAAAQHDMAIPVAARAGDRRLAVAVDAEEAVRAGRRDDRVDRHLEVAIGGVLEADRCGQARCHLAVGLRFRGARTDCGPGDEVAVVLRRDRVERLGGGGQADLADVEQELARALHADVDAEGVVHERIVDEALPAGRGARLLEIDAHDQQQGVGDLVGEFLEPARIVQAGHGIVDRARPDHHEHARVLAVEDVHHRLAACHHRRGCALGERHARLDLLGRRHVVEGKDVEVFGLGEGHCWAPECGQERP